MLKTSNPPFKKAHARHDPHYKIFCKKEKRYKFWKVHNKGKPQDLFDD